MEQTHAGEAGLGDLRRADRIIRACGLAPALRIQPRIALAKTDEVGLYPVCDAEIKMLAVRGLEEARGAEVFITATFIPAPTWLNWSTMRKE